jgi:hypothetical protein
MTRAMSWVVAGCLANFGNPEVAMASAAHSVPRFFLEVSSGPVDGPGEGYANLTDFRVKDIGAGRVGRLTAGWAFADQWYLNGDFGKFSLDYGSPLGARCPFDIAFIRGNGFCFSDGITRTPNYSISDEGREYGLRLGYRRKLAEAVGVYGELGIRHMRWRSPNDTEAGFVALCSSPYRVGDCAERGKDARETGAVAAIGFIAELLPGMSADLSWNYQGFRHRVWRIDVADRFYESNCDDPDACVDREALEVATIGESDWNWYALGLAYEIHERWTIGIDLERGGSRGWAVSTLGIRYSFD